jgi:signal transduction histidine kinase
MMCGNVRCSCSVMSGDARVRCLVYYKTEASFPMMEVVSQAVQIIHPQIEQKHLTLHVYIPPDLPCIEVDPERVAQILRNLL